MKPALSEHPSYFERYIQLVEQDEVVNALVEARKEALALIKTIPERLENHAYAEGKWTIKEVFIHCIDTERIFSTRALGFARGEAQKALAYDENVYAAHSKALLRSLRDIAAELENVNAATVALFSSFDTESLEASGETPSGKATVNAIGFAICGHLLHHMGVLRERYLK